MTEIWHSEGAIAHFLAVSMCRVTLDTAIDTFATGLYVRHSPAKLRLPQPPLTLAEGAGSSAPLAST